MTPKEFYTSEAKRKLGFYFAAWLPSTRFELGDVGEMDGTAFRRLRNLKDVGISFDVLGDDKPSGLDIASGEGVAVTFKVAGEANPELPNIPTASAGVGFDFGHEGAFVIQASAVHEPSIADIAKLQDDILAAYKRGEWQIGWKVIVRLVRTADAVILISQSANAKVEITASGSVPVGPFKLTDANISLGVSHSSGDVIRVDRGEEVTPLFQLAGIHWKWWPFTHEARLEKAVAGTAVPAPTPEQAAAEPNAAGALYLDLLR